jgi:hypothetical protein
MAESHPSVLLDEFIQEGAALLTGHFAYLGGAH